MWVIIFLSALDGVLEAFNDQQLVHGLSEDISLKLKLEAIASICHQSFKRQLFCSIAIEIGKIDQNKVFKEKNLIKKVITLAKNIFSPKFINP